MHVDESRMTYLTVVNKVPMYPLYLCQYLCVVLQVEQLGSCRRAYGRKIAVLLQGDLLRYCLFMPDVLTALIALR
jgi:hypothetical protein